MENQLYYIAVNGQPTGPFNLEQIRQHHKLANNTLVWNETMTQWTAAGNIPELQAIIAEQWQASQVPPQMPNYQQTQPPHPNNYQYQQNQYQQPYYGNTPPMPKTWLAESILATLFCCLPLGIVGIIKASNVSSHYNRGNYAGAEAASKEAGKWTKWSFFCGIAITLCYLLFYGVAIFSAFNLNDL